MATKGTKKNAKVNRQAIIEKIQARAARSGIVEVGGGVAVELKETKKLATKKLASKPAKVAKAPAKRVKKLSPKRPALAIEPAPAQRPLTDREILDGRKPDKRDLPRVGKTGVLWAGSPELDPKAYDKQGHLLCKCGERVTSQSSINKRERLCGACCSAHRQAMAERSATA